MFAVSDVQLENGFTRIANELMDAVIRYEFSKRQMKVALVVIRQTYGYQRKSDRIPIARIEELTGIDRSNASKALKELIAMGVVQRFPGREIGINKDHSQWGCGQNDHNKVVKTTTVCGQNNHTTCRPKVVKTTTKTGQNDHKNGSKQPPQKKKEKRKEPPVVPQARKRRGKQVTQQFIRSMDLPPSIPRELWLSWCDHRVEIGHPMGEQAARATIKQWGEIVEQGYDLESCVEDGLIGGWRKLFPKPENKKGGQPHGRSQDRCLVDQQLDNIQQGRAKRLEREAKGELTSGGALVLQFGAR